MVLKYMVTNTDSEKGELGQSAMEAEQPETEVKKSLEEIVSKVGMRTFNPEDFYSHINRNVKFWFFLMIITFLGAVVYYLWTADLIRPTLKSLSTDKVVVTAILYSDEKASAVISDNVVREGDVINGYTVVTIYKDKVELEKNGKRITKQVYVEQK